VAEPLVIVQDDDDSSILYRLRNFVGFDTISLAALGGRDVFNLVGRDDGSLQINVDGGEGFNFINLDATTLNDQYSVSSLEATNDAGLLVVRHGSGFHAGQLREHRPHVVGGAGIASQ
jgi:hypothetical protein